MLPDGTSVNAPLQPPAVDESFTLHALGKPRWYVPYGRNRRYLTFALCGVAPVVGLLWGLPFISRLQLNIDPPKNSDAYVALTAFEAAFPLEADGMQNAYILLLSMADGAPVLNMSSPDCDWHGLELAMHCPLLSPLEQVSDELEAWAYQQLPGWFNDTTFMSYSKFRRKKFSLLQKGLLNAPETPRRSTSTILRLQVPQNLSTGSASHAFTANLINATDAFARSAARAAGLGATAVTVETAGMPAFIMAAQVGVKRDMELMDMVSLPLALLIFLLMLRSARLLLLPILNIGVVAGFGFALMYPISLHMSVGSTVPSLMVSVAIATSIDYSLFLLSRFREEIERGRRPVAAVELMMGAAGHTVLVSGATLSFCFVGLAAFPIEMLTTMGLGAGATTVLSVAVNLTLTPSCLLTFPRFFSAFEWGGLACVVRWCCPDRAAPSRDPLVLRAGHPGAIIMEPDGPSAIGDATHRPAYAVASGGGNGNSHGDSHSNSHGGCNGNGHAAAARPRRRRGGGDAACGSSTATRTAHEARHRWRRAGVVVGGATAEADAATAALSAGAASPPAHRPSRC